MTKQTGRSAILQQFVADDITYMFGNPGTVEQGFLDALDGTPPLQYILGLQETIPLAMADGYARATKRPAVVQLHTGVGLGNGIGMMYQAMRGHTPLVVIAGDAGIRYDAMDAQMACDLMSMAAPVTKWATRVVDPSSLLRVVRRAIKMAATPPMGPVFVALPMDVLDAPCSEDVLPTSILDTHTAPRPEAIAHLASRLAGATHPMIIMGDGISISGAQAELAEVAELLGADVYGADNSEMNMDATHPLYLGNLGHMFGSHSTPIVSEADAVLIVGTYVFPEVFPTLTNVFGNATVAHIDLDAYEIAKNFPVDIGLVADPKLALAALAEALGAVRSPDQAKAADARVKTSGERKQRAIDEAKKADTAVRECVPMTPAPFMQELAGRLDDEAVIFDEALTSSPELNRYLPPRKPGHFFQTHGGSLGVGIPGAIGLKLAHPDKTVIGFTGDGGSMYTIQALWTAARYNIGAKFVICNNRRYKLLELNIEQYWKERGIPKHAFPSAFSLGRPPLRFADLSEALSVPARRIEKPDEIGPLLDEMLGTDGPFLVDLALASETPSHQTGCKCGQ